MNIASKKKFYFLILVIGSAFFIYLAFYLVNKDPRTKVCSPVGDRLKCELCSCPRGDALPGLGGAACADGAKPTCEALP